MNKLLIEPISAAEMIEFRKLLFPVKVNGDQFSETSRQREIAAVLGINPSSVHRMENGSPILHGVLIRRGLVNVADELEIKIPNRLRYGVAGKAKRATA